MRDVWGFDIDEMPIEPFDIQVRIKAPSVLEGLQLFERAVASYMTEHFDAYNRSLYLERLHWHDATAAMPHCEIFHGRVTVRACQSHRAKASSRPLSLAQKIL